MAKRGPKATTPRRHKHQARLPAASVAPPAYLSRRAAAEWKRLAGPLRDLGLFTVGDLAVMVSYCETFAELVELTELLQTVELVERFEVYKLRSAAIHRLGGLTRKLGLDPRARTNLAPPPEPEPEDDPFAEFTAP